MTHKSFSKPDRDEQEVDQETHPCIEELLAELSVDESIIAKSLGDIRKGLQNQGTTLKTIVTSLQQVLERDCAPSTSDEYLRIVAECQKQTAALAGNELERHALNPAIETVFILTIALQDLGAQSAALNKSQTCPFVSSILHSIAEAVKLANDKCEYLDIVKIEPKELDDLDPQQHEIIKTVRTRERDKHRKIQASLIPGLLYRGKVLRQARVCIYRYVEN